MAERSRIVFHRGYSILKSKYGTFRLLPKNAGTIAGLKWCEERYGYGYMHSAHPEFKTLAECVEYIDKNYPEQQTDTGRGNPPTT
jgi:hypothetical protein